ncbi:MAG: hypothetical protein R2856_00595 [Caldilineaceae bacterium]
MTVARVANPRTGQRHDLQQSHESNSGSAVDREGYEALLARLQGKVKDLTMQFGWRCCSLDQAEAAKAAGFDFIECTVRSLTPEVDEFAPIQAAYAASPLPVKAFNVFLPGDLKITGPAVDWPAVETYVDEALRRVHPIGAHGCLRQRRGATSLQVLSFRRSGRSCSVS